MLRGSVSCFSSNFSQTLRLKSRTLHCKKLVRNKGLIQMQMRKKKMIVLLPRLSPDHHANQFTSTPALSALSGLIGQVTWRFTFAPIQASVLSVAAFAQKPFHRLRIYSGT